MNICYQNNSFNPHQPIFLHTIWNVEVGSEYQVVTRKQSQQDYITVRTKSGDGRILLQGEWLIVQKDSLLITPRERLEQYQTEGGHWEFLWFEFTAKEPVETVFQMVPSSQTETLLTAEMLHSMTHHGDTASAGMWYLLHHWRTGIQHATASLAEKIASYLDSLPTDQLYDVRQLETSFSHSERTLRSQFLTRYGITPKVYHQQKRLQAATTLLITTDLKLSAIAARCGFSNEYYFSRVFHQHTGKSPGEFRSQK